MSTGGYIPDIDLFFQSAFFNGTVNGVVESTILPGATYNDLLTSINDKAQKINVDVTLSNSVLRVSQSDPWNVNVTLISDFVMKDRQGLARWNKKQSISAIIPVTYFEDPLFTINSLARISRKINKTIYEGNYVSGSDVSNLLSHVNSHYYTEKIGRAHV